MNLCNSMGVRDVSGLKHCSSCPQTFALGSPICLPGDNVYGQNESLTYTMFLGSFLPFTPSPSSHRSFFLAGNWVETNFELAWVGRISHHGASESTKEKGHRQKE